MSTWQSRLRPAIFHKKYPPPKPFFYFDMHCHILPKVDDGATSEEEMQTMLRMAYQDGTRKICFTPHFSPYHFDDNSQATEEAFALAKKFVGENFPDMKLYLANEMGYYGDCIADLENAKCRTLGGSGNLLVDFPQSVNSYELERGLFLLLQQGFSPILAHTERYECLRVGLSGKEKTEKIFHLRENGVAIQLNAESIAGKTGKGEQNYCRLLLDCALADLICSDAHHAQGRIPLLSVCRPYLDTRYPPAYIYALLYGNAARMIKGNNIFHPEKDSEEEHDE